MGWQMDSMTFIYGETKAIKEIEELLNNREELVERFSGVEVWAKEKKESKNGLRLFVMLTTRKRTPTDFFEFCESLGCHVNATTIHEDDGEMYDTEQEREYGAQRREDELAELEAKLAEAKEESEKWHPPVAGDIQMDSMYRGLVAMYQDQIKELQEKMAGDVWDQALESERTKS
mgnify:CR=1 FL=1